MGKNKGKKKKFFVPLLILLIISQYGDPATSTMLSFPFNGGGAINLYTILFILFFGIGYGAYYATADMPIPMVADCSDYETYRSGKYIPGIMGTLFSLVDKLVSSLAQRLANADNASMPENAVDLANKLVLNSVKLDILLVQKTNQSLGHG